MSQEIARPPPRIVAVGDSLANRYQLIRLLSEGRVSHIYTARDLRAGSMVAIKALSAEEGGAAVDILAREAFILQRLDHPNIIRCRADHCDSPLPFIALDLAGDGSLQDRLDQHGALSRRAVLLVALAVVDALEVCHACGVLHRDIKPQNVLFHHQRTLLADFDVASHPDLPSAPALRSGAFLAPELLKSPTQASPQTDIYGLCATLYYALTGWNPYRLFDAAFDSPRWAALDEATRDLLYRGTRASPRARIPGLATFKAELLHLLVSGPQEPTPLPSPDAASRESTEFS